MKDYTQKELERSRPSVDTEDAIAYCLECLYRDTKHTLQQEVVDGLTFEELIGALILAKHDVRKGS